MSAGFWTGVAVLLGVIILILIATALRRGEFDAETPKYEMLGRRPPAATQQVSGDSSLGITDRVVRLGLLGAVFHYAAVAGWTTVPGLALCVAGIWLAATGLFGRDPLVGWLRRRDTRPEKG